MKATITSTDAIVQLVMPDAEVRVWRGKTEDGVEFLAYIPLMQAVRGTKALDTALLAPHPPADALTLNLIEIRDVAVRHCRAARQAMMHAIMSP